MDLGTPELLLILVIVILVFGVGRIGKLGSELGQGLRAFREGLSSNQEEKPNLNLTEQPVLSSTPSPGEEHQRTE
jgi:sec-independent protein translocase protein TatA